MMNIKTTAQPECPPQVQPVPNLIAIASGKGGVGKTFISASLSYALAKGGQRVLLFDGDLGLANVDVQLGLMPSHDLGSVIAGKITLDKAICNALPNHKETDCAGRFDILAGKSGSGALNALPKAQLMGLARGLTEVARTYDLVIIDLPAGLDKAVTTMSARASKILVIVTDEPTSLTDAYAYIKITARHADRDNFFVVVNQANSIGEAKLTFQSLKTACVSFLQVEPKLLGVIRKDTKVRDTIRHQIPIFDRWPECNASQDLDQLGRKLNKIMTPENSS